MSTSRLLDLTRLVSRAGMTPTGVDRVEKAYLDELKGSAYGLVRTALGVVLLDPAGLQRLADAIEQNEWPRPDLVSRINRRLSPAARRGQTLSRQIAIARCRRSGLQAMLARHLTNGFEYYNVGHSHLDRDALSAIKAADGKIHVLIHDTIPLDLPQMQRDGTVASFRRKFDVATTFADRIICSTEAVAADVLRHAPNAVTNVAPLGVVAQEPASLAPDLRPDGPYFVMLGTIEPRKNHRLLLDIWDNWPDAPPLLLCGRRGWKNADVFDRLDAGVPNVVELPGLSDGQIATLLSGATALLFPSFAEGFGLPPAEAAALGTSVVVSDLPACREVLGDAAIYLDPSDGYRWTETVKGLAAGTIQRPTLPYVPPNWETHFKLVFTG